MPEHQQPPEHNRRRADRFDFRVGLFKRRGESPERAEQLAARLAQRDAERDDRRICLECARMQPSRSERPDGCLAARSGWFKPDFAVDRFLIPLRDVLQRCPCFEFARPQ